MIQTPEAIFDPTPSGSFLNTADASTSKYDERYKMCHDSRGKAVIFNHEEYSTELKIQLNMDLTREGTENDKKQLEKTLKNLGFDVESCDDLNTEGVMKKLDEISKEDHKDRDALLIVVMTHGGRGRWENGEYGTWLYAHDNKYDINCLWSPFTADKCLTLANKPKIFFIQLMSPECLVLFYGGLLCAMTPRPQACQGYFTDAGQKIAFNREDSKTDTDKFNEPKPLKPVKPVENRPASFTIPNQADFMLCFSTIPGFVSFINPDKGTIFIQTLCKVLEKKSSSTHLMDMMTEVIRKIAVGYKSSSKENQEIDNKKQMPCIVSLMTRQVFFESRLDHPETAETEVNKDDVDLDRALKGLNAIKKQQHAINKQLEEVTINVKGLQRSSSRRSSIRRFFNIFRKKN